MKLKISASHLAVFAICFMKSLAVIETRFRRRPLRLLLTRWAWALVAGFVEMDFAEAADAVDAGSDNGVGQLQPVLIRGRDDNLLGQADSATQGTVGSAQLEARPMLRVGELLETVPGVIVTQHAGGGKANQYFLRGFNLDHGTDFAVSLDGVPLNLPSHGHGQGYTDLNSVIPELVATVNYQKGLYYAENGDFAAAGAAHLEGYRVLPQSISIVEAGQYGYARGVYAASPKLGDGHLLYGFEAYHHDGPWRNPDDYQKYNGILSFSRGDFSEGFSVTARGYHGRWDSSDQVPMSVVQSGNLPRFSSLDDTTGGIAQRYGLQAEWHRFGDESATRVMGYGVYSGLDLFSNFTYFLNDADRGDQFEQTDRRAISGLQVQHTMFREWWDREVENGVGLQLRSDNIRNGLFQTQFRQRVDKISAADGGVLASVTRSDAIWEDSLGLYLDNHVRWAPWFRTVAGVRGDLLYVDVAGDRTENSGQRWAGLPSPKFTAVFGPWARTEFYLQGGLGFHSNDGRGATLHVDPVTGSTRDADGHPIQPADPLVRTSGYEWGVRSEPVKGWQSTLSLWALDVDSELVFVGDAGTTEASRASRRYGVEWANYHALTRHWTLDADFSLSQARFRDWAPEGNRIPGSVGGVVAAGISYRRESGFFGSLRLRYFGSRPLSEDDRFRSPETLMLNAQLGYHFNSTWTFSGEILNLLDRRDHDIDYAYESRATPTADAMTQMHFHPVEPFQIRLSIAARF